MRYDCAVIGLGGMGAACTSYLAKARKVIAFDQFESGHMFGSSGCESRIFRFSCFEGKMYSELALKSFELWESLEAQTGIKFFDKTGGLMMGKPDSPVVVKTKKCVVHSRGDIEEMSATDVRRRFPAFYLPADHVAIYEVHAGIISPQRAQRAMLMIAQNYGASLVTNARVKRIEVGGTKIRIFTSRDDVEVNQVVLCCGPWMSDLLPAEYQHWIQPERIVPLWFKPLRNITHFRSSVMPFYYWDLGNDSQIYGFPMLRESSEGVKVGFDSDRRPTTALNLDRVVSPEEVATIRSILKDRIPDLNGKFVRGHACMFSMSPDKDFIIGNLPGVENIFIVGGFSGRGYKFCTAIGQMIADLVTQGSSPLFHARFDPNRLTKEL